MADEEQKSRLNRNLSYLGIIIGVLVFFAIILFIVTYRADRNIMLRNYDK